MISSTHLARVIMAIFILIAGCEAAYAGPTAVWTEHNDNSRTGQNLTETTLTPSNVGTTAFGKLFAYNLDDESYSQPLYVPGLTMAVDGQVHNVVFVTTVNNSVYAFDADNSQVNGGQPLWHVSLTPSGARPPNVNDADAQGIGKNRYHDFSGQYGIVGTPVIDTSSNTLYVVARDVESAGFVQRLHALSLTDGAEKFGGPVSIAGTYNGVAFDPALNNQRPALALVNGTIYIGWSSHGDNGPYHGFVIAYNASTLAQTGAWASTSGSGIQGGIWQAGQAFTADSAGNIYLMTGNGTWDGKVNFGESAVKLSPALGVLDYFTPSNYTHLNSIDDDLGSAGCLGIPGTSLIFGGGKQGMVYLLNTANLGHEHSTDNVVQEFQATFPQGGATGHIHGGPVYFDTGNNQYIYLWGENDYLRVYQFTNGATGNQGSINSTPVATSTMLAPVSSSGMPGGFMSISADGNQNGIVWAYTPYNGDANQHTVAGILHAFDAQTFTNGSLDELWNSQQNATRDSVGNYAKYTYPTVVNGKVYISTFGSATSGSGQLIAYGELSQTPQIEPAAGKYITSVQVSITDATASAPIWYTVDGSEPTPGSGSAKLYTGPFTLTGSAKVQAIAVPPGAALTAVASSTFTVDVAPPSFHPTGTVTCGTPVTITVSTPGAAIYYTTDGTSPRPGAANTTLYTGPFPILQSCTVTAIGALAGDGGSGNKSTTYIGVTPTPSMSPKAGTIAAATPITITDPISTATIWYTIDGSVPVPGSGTAIVYTDPVTIEPGTTLNAVATLPNANVSSIRSSKYPMTNAPKPTLSPNGGTHTGTAGVTITDTAPGAVMYYTLDGSTPVPGSGTTLQYTSTFTLKATTVVKAIAVAPYFLNSGVTSATFTIKASTPSITPAAGTLEYPAKITIHDSSSGSTIYYTIDGSTPIAGGGGTTITYTGAFNLAGPAVVQAIATAPGMIAGSVESATYN